VGGVEISSYMASLILYFHNKGLLFLLTAVFGTDIIAETQNQRTMLIIGNRK
jgi:hypothetical protein